MRLKYKMFKLNEEKLDLICELKGWKYKTTDLAKATGFTKAYISQVLNGKAALCESFMLAYIRVAGMNPANPKEWGSLFHIEQGIEKPSSHQKNNNAKYEGKKPYSPMSFACQIRTEDKARNLERLASDKPIPAIDFYDEAVKNWQIRARFLKKSA